MLGLLQLEGYELVQDPQRDRFCRRQHLRVHRAGSGRIYAHDRRDAQTEEQAGKTRGVIVSGCLAERQKRELRPSGPTSTALVGVFGREQETESGGPAGGRLARAASSFNPAPVKALPEQDRLRITPRHFAYLKVSEGCDRLCTFCAIPQDARQACQQTDRRDCGRSKPAGGGRRP